MQKSNRFATYQARKGIAGRIEEYIETREFLDGRAEQGGYALAFVTGKTGIGKTAFIEDIRAEMKKERDKSETDWAVGHVDFTNPERRTSERALAQIRVNLAAEHSAAFPCFDAALAILFKESNPQKSVQEEYPRIYNSNFNELGDELLSWLGEREVVKDTVGGILGEIPGANFLKSTVLKFAESAWDKIKTWDVRDRLSTLEQMTTTEIRELLPDILAFDIERLQERRPELTFAFIADGLEHIGSDDDWLRTLVQNTQGHRWIVSGSEMPEWDQHGFEDVRAAQIALEPLDPGEVSDYLTRHEIFNEKAIDLIIDAAQGYPPHLELLMNRYQVFGGDAKPYRAIKAVRETARSEISPLSALSQEDRNRLGLLSLVMPLDRGTFDFLKEEFPLVIGVADWNGVLKSGQVVGNEDGTVELPQDVRDAVLRDFEGREPKLCASASARLRKHFVARAEAVDPAEEPDEELRLRIMSVQSLRYGDPRGYRKAYRALAEDLLANREFSGIETLRKRQKQDAPNAIWGRASENENVQASDLYARGLNLWMDATMALRVLPPRTYEARKAAEKLYQLTEDTPFFDPALCTEMGILIGESRALNDIADLATEVGTKAQMSGADAGLTLEQLSPVEDLDRALCGRGRNWDQAIVAAGKILKLGLRGEVEDDTKALLELLRQREFRVSRNCLADGGLVRYVAPPDRLIVLSGPDEYLGEPVPVVAPALARIKAITKLLGDGPDQKFEFALLQAEAKKVKDDYVMAEPAYMRAFEVADNDEQRASALYHLAKGIADKGDGDFFLPRLKTLAEFTMDESNDIRNEVRADIFQKIADMRLQVGHKPISVRGDLDRALGYTRWAPGVTRELCEKIIRQTVRIITSNRKETNEYGIDSFEDRLPFLQHLLDALEEGGPALIQCKPRTREEAFAEMERDRERAAARDAEPEIKF